MLSLNVGCFLSLLQEIALIYLPLSSSIFSKPYCAVSFCTNSVEGDNDDDEEEDEEDDDDDESEDETGTNIIMVRY